MKKLSLSVSCLFIIVSSYAQKLPIHLNNDSNRYNYPPLFVLKTPDNITFISLNPTVLNGTDPNTIDSLSILKDSSAVKAYGSRARNGVIIIKYKINVTITESDTNKLAYILQTYKPDIQIGKLPVYIDSVWIKHPEEVYLEPRKIKSAKVETEAGTGIKFIDIVTVTPPPLNLKKGEIMIRGNG